MKSILDFIYNGSTNVQENQLTQFLVTANDLKIRGLVETSKLQADKISQSLDIGTTKEEVDSDDDADDDGQIMIPDSEPEVAETHMITPEGFNAAVDESIHDDLGPDYGPPLVESPAAALRAHVTPDNKYKREKLMSPQFATPFSCTICGKSFAYKHVLENHVETHLDNAYPCDICNKIFKTRNSLKSHLSQRHRPAAANNSISYKTEPHPNI